MPGELAVNEDIAVGERKDAAMFSLDQGMAHGGSGRLGSEVAVAFDDAFKMGMREDEHGAVFALNEWVAPARGGVDAGEIAEVKTGDIHGMD